MLNRKLHYKSGPDRLVLLDADRAMMLFDDAADDRQPKPGATLLRREVGEEETLLQLRGDAVTGVADADFDDVRITIDARCANLDLFDERILHRFGRVVDQVGEDALYRVRVGHHRRQ